MKLDDLKKLIKLNKKENTDYLRDNLFIGGISINPYTNEVYKTNLDYSFDRLTKPATNYEEFNQLSVVAKNDDNLDDINLIGIVDSQKITHFIFNDKEEKLSDNNYIENVFPQQYSFNGKDFKLIPVNAKFRYSLLKHYCTYYEFVDCHRVGKQNSKCLVYFVNELITNFHKFYSQDVANVFSACLLKPIKEQVIDANNNALDVEDLNGTLYKISLQKDEFNKALARTKALLHYVPLLAIYMEMPLFLCDILKPEIAKVYDDYINDWNDNTKEYEKTQFEDYIKKYIKKNKKQMAKYKILNSNLKNLFNEEEFNKEYELAIKELEKTFQRKLFVLDKKEKQNKFSAESLLFNNSHKFAAKPKKDYVAIVDDIMVDDDSTLDDDDFPF